MSTAQSIVDRVRETVNDEDVTGLRTSDAKMLRHVNDFLLDAAILRPDLFSTIANITCTQGRMVQKAPAGSIRLLNIYGPVGGNPVTKVDFAYMDRHYGRRWRSAQAATALHWIPHESNPNEFYIFPQSPVGQSVVAEYAVNATALQSLNDPLPSAISPMYDVAAHDYAVFRIESKDDESVLTQRAELFLRKFAAGMSVSLKQLEEVLVRTARIPMQQKA